jgi:flagellar protein FliS
MTVTTYQVVDALTATGPRIVLVLYDAAIQRLELALRALDCGDVAEFARRLNRAHALVAALAEALDQARGGEFARRLAGLYGFALLHLTRALAARDRRPVEEVLRVLRPLREGFAGAAAALGP